MSVENVRDSGTTSPMPSSTGQVKPSSQWKGYKISKQISEVTKRTNAISIGTRGLNKPGDESSSVGETKQKKLFSSKTLKAIKNAKKSVIKTAKRIGTSAFKIFGNLSRPLKKAAEAIRKKGQTNTPTEVSFNRVNSYDDIEARKGPKEKRTIKSDIPISFLPINKHVQSIFRIPNKMDLIIKKGSQETQLIWNKQTDDKETNEKGEVKGVHEMDRKNTLETLFNGVNKMLGRNIDEEETKNDIEHKIKTYSDFDSKDETVNPFDINGKRIDRDGKNEDILILKYITKEVAGYAIVPLSQQLRDFCKSEKIDKFTYTVPIRDQLEKCEIEIKEDDTGFTVRSEITIPLKKENKTICSIKVKLKTDVDSKTGGSKVEVERSNLRFENDVSKSDQEKVFIALNKDLPGST